MCAISRFPFLRLPQQHKRKEKEKKKKEKWLQSKLAISFKQGDRMTL
jgi:hypothetical protein